jgi:solute carrier family 25 (mitochondrial citrate transporter), member 1
LKTKGVTGLYSGCSALVVGNAVKAGVRFVSYDYFKGKLADSEVSMPSPACATHI